MNISEPLQAAIDEFNKFPGIGRKTAQRLALFLLELDNQEVSQFLSAVSNLKEKLRFCKACFNLTDRELCDICESPKRDRSIVCVVEDISDVMAIERSNEYNGLYHVLGGVLSPLSGISQEDLHIAELMARLRDDTVSEVILALNADTEGETTSLYLAKLIKPLNIAVSRIARGLPIGGDLEFADDATIARAVSGRIRLE